MIAHPSQFTDDHSDVLTTLGQLDVEQFLDRMVPRHLVHGRADVVLAVDDRTYWLKFRCSPSFSNPECRYPMSGVALTIRSPSNSRMRRSVVCVAGC